MSNSSILKIKEALERERARIPANYVCWIIEAFDAINEVDRICVSETHSTKKYRVETNFKLNVILKVDEK